MGYNITPFFHLLHRSFLANITVYRPNIHWCPRHSHWSNIRNLAGAPVSRNRIWNSHDLFSIRNCKVEKTLNMVKAIAWFLILEFVLLLFALLISGTFSVNAVPLELITDIALSAGTSVWAITIGMFIIGTFVNMVLMFFNIIKGGF